MYSALTSIRFPCATGPIFSLDVPGLHVVVLNTYEVAADIFGEDTRLSYLNTTYFCNML